MWVCKTPYSLIVHSTSSKTAPSLLLKLLCRNPSQSSQTTFKMTDATSTVMHRSRTTKRVPLILYTVFWLGLGVLEVPSVALIGRAICSQVISHSRPKEAECKGAEVQDTLSKVLGWKLASNSLAGKSLITDSMSSQRSCPVECVSYYGMFGWSFARTFRCSVGIHSSDMFNRTTHRPPLW